MNELVSIAFNDKPIRSTLVNGEPFFVLKDILESVGSSTHPSDAAKAVETYLGPEQVQRVSVVDNLRRNRVTLTTSVAGAIYILVRSTSARASSAIKSLLALVKDGAAIIEALNTFEVPEDLPDMFVYAIRETETGNIKLGISKDPEARLRQLQTGNSQQLELIAYKKAENKYADEKALHNQAAAYHIRGEWFDPASIDIIELA